MPYDADPVTSLAGAHPNLRLFRTAERIAAKTYDGRWMASVKLEETIEPTAEPTTLEPAAQELALA